MRFTFLDGSDPQDVDLTYLVSESDNEPDNILVYQVNGESTFATERVAKQLTAYEQKLDSSTYKFQFDHNNETLTGFVSSVSFSDFGKPFTTIYIIVDGK